MEPAAPTDYERVGEARLRALIDDFVATVLADTMIGFHFRGVDAAQLSKREFQFTARALGARMPYEGRPIKEAHAPFAIMGGQFARRAWLLREALERHDVPADIVARLIAHMDRLRPLITAQPDSMCNAGSATGPLMVSWRPDDPG